LADDSVVIPLSDVHNREPDAELPTGKASGPIPLTAIPEDGRGNQLHMLPIGNTVNAG